MAADFRSFNLNTMRHYRPSGGGALRHRLWICKPRGGFNSVGIHMHSLPTEEPAVAVAAVVAVAVALAVARPPQSYSQ